MISDGNTDFQPHRLPVSSALENSATSGSPDASNGVGCVKAGQNCVRDVQASVPSSEAPSDEELVAIAQNGVTSAFEELLTRHRPLLYRTVRRYAVSPDEADDLVQETSFRAFIKIGTFRGEARFSSWLVAIAANAALSHKRKENRLRWVSIDDSENGEDRSYQWVVPDMRRNPEQEYSRMELRRLLRREISRQHPKFQGILQACILDESPLDEAARTLGISHGAAKSRLHRARKQLFRTFRRHTETHCWQPVVTNCFQEP
jgi:RNA polymerase sigma-70 factor (ECF subfamily)